MLLKAAARSKLPGIFSTTQNSLEVSLSHSNIPESRLVRHGASSLALGKHNSSASGVEDYYSSAKNGFHET